IALCWLLAAPLEARQPRRRDPRTVGLGRNCAEKSECGHRRQICLKESDANGKLLKQGMCVLPCTRLDAGLKQSDLDATVDGGPKKAAPPRCPKRFECRAAGAGVPIDLCVRQ